MDTELSYIGSYAVQAVIGEGSFGKVYQAYQPFLDRHVAIKMLRAEALGDVRVNGHFIHEARTIARLRHPNIVTVYEFGSLPAEPEPMTYMVMEYLPGESLYERLERQRLSAKEVISIIEQLAQGLDYAHAQGVIHRDLTPSNVIFSAQNQPVIVDFGLAQLFEMSRGSQIENPRQTSIKGTPAYMAPEQVLGDRITPVTDQYALAVIAYEMLSGAVPFSGDGAYNLMMARVYSTPAPLAEKHDLPLAVDSVIFKAMALDAAERYSNATAFAQALGEALLPDDYRPKVILDPLQAAELKAARQTIAGFMWGLAFAVLVIGLFCLSLVLRAILNNDIDYLIWRGIDTPHAVDADLRLVTWVWFDAAAARAGLQAGDLLPNMNSERYITRVNGIPYNDEHRPALKVGDILEQPIIRNGEVLTIRYALVMPSYWFVTLGILAIPNAVSYFGGLWMLRRWGVRRANRLMVPILLLTSLTLVSVYVNDQLPYLDSLVFYVLTAMLLHFMLIFPTRLPFIEKHPRLVWLAYPLVTFGIIQFMFGSYLDIFGRGANEIGYPLISIALIAAAIGKWGVRDLRRYPALGWFAVGIVAAVVATMGSTWAYDWWDGEFSEMMSLMFIAGGTSLAVLLGMLSYHLIMRRMDEDNATLPTLNVVVR